MCPDAQKRPLRAPPPQPAPPMAGSATARCIAMATVAILCAQAAQAAPGGARLRFAAASGALDPGASHGSVTEHKTGRLVRCRFRGNPELEEADAEGGYFAHEFTRAECGGAVPGPRCMGAIHSTYHCGQDEQWSIIAAGEQGRSKPTVRWFNYLPCPGDVADVTVDFFCPNGNNAAHLYHCARDGPAERVPTAPAADAAAAAAALPASGPGRYRYLFQNGDCRRGTAGGAPGLPVRNKACVTAFRRTVHCGGDHDWAVGNNSADSRPGMTWFTSHECDAAHIGADYFCPADAPRHLHRCTYQARSPAAPPPPSSALTPALPYPALRAPARTTLTAQPNR